LRRAREPSFLEKLAFAYRTNKGWIEDWPRRPAQDSESAKRVQALEAKQELASVIKNLFNVLRTRKSHGSVLVDYGVGDYDEPQRVKDSIDILGREIQQAAARYEPRLQRPRVQAVSRDASRRIHYQLTGTLAGAPVKIMVSFDTIHRAVISVVEA
jgi:type VI secretion system lysozyme-like protein